MITIVLETASFSKVRNSVE